MRDGLECSIAVARINSLSKEVELAVTREICKRETLGVRIDQSGKFSAMTFLRAMDPSYGSSNALIKLLDRKSVV